MRAIVPLQVASTAEDVAEVVMFLAGPASRNMTGEITVADAGYLLADIPPPPTLRSAPGATRPNSPI
jgi:enoyl-[acyl-carrier-protein] reductase (NADH)